MSMKLAFIVAEYNPFHNGHAYHIARTRSELAPDAVICVMSGHFTQRGEPSVADKWTRARMALRGGADLVLELHPAYACAGAEAFARGALLTLSALGAGGWLSFGAECGDAGLLGAISRVLADEPEPFKARLAAELGRGISFAEARAHAAAGVIAMQDADAHAAERSVGAGTANAAAERGIDPDTAARAERGIGHAAAAVERVMRTSNNILALEYMKTIRLYGLPFKPYIVPRTGAGHLDEAIPDEGLPEAHDDGGGISSATAIRAHIRRAVSGCGHNSIRARGHACVDAPYGIPRDSYCAIPYSYAITCSYGIPYGLLPGFTSALLASEFELGRGPVFPDHFFPAILTLLRRSPPESLRAWPGVREGLENRITRAARRAQSYSGLVEAIAAKRYPMSGVSRLLCHMLLGLDRQTLANVTEAESTPPYLRVLGFTERGRGVLAAVSPSVPAVTNFKTAAHSRDARVRAFAELEARATDIYVTAFLNPAFRASGSDFRRGPAMI